MSLTTGIVAGSFRRPAPGGGGGVPTTGLVAHWDFGAGVTLDGSSRISQVDDQSGNGYHLTQATAGNRPRIAATKVNGRDAVEFDGVSVSRWLTIPTAVGVIKTIAFVMDADVAATSSATHPFGWYLLVGGGSNLFVLAANADTWNAFVRSGYWQNGVDDNPAPSVTPLNQPNVVTALGHAINGWSFATNARMGSDQFATANRNFGGRIAEVLFYSTFLSTGDRQALEDYLGTKYGITITH